MNNEEKHFRSLPIIALVPNLFTLLSLAVGTNAIRLSSDGAWEIAVGSIVVCAIIDALDGRIARILNVSSKFGAELDSLCDFVSFGIAPAMTIYFWIIDSLDVEFKKFSWTVSILFIVCMAIRLARFNVGPKDLRDKIVARIFFKGIPAPAGGLLLLLPLMIDFRLSSHLDIDVKSHMTIIHIFAIIIALLLSSPLATYSIKNIKIRRELIWLFLVLFGISIITLTMYPWYVLPVVGIVYIVSILFSIVHARKLS